MELSVDDLNTLNPQEVCVVCASILHPNPGGNYRGNSPLTASMASFSAPRKFQVTPLLTFLFASLCLLNSHSMSMNIKMVHRSLFKLGIFSNVNVHEHLTVATSTQL